MSDKLDTYRAKRSASATGEPFGGAAGPREFAGLNQFVVQKHAATRLHWDVRLEIDGVLRSWAVPRGPSLDPDVKRLAVMTEDHPLEYLNFEGVIPAGNYGAGNMIVWDRGVWQPLEPLKEGFEKGKLLFALHGQKLQGVWTLFRTRKSGENEWLMVKKPDEGSTVAGAREPNEVSIYSGLLVEELTEGCARHEALLDDIAACPPAPPFVPGPEAIMLPKVRAKAFSDEAWVYELKYDGYRLVATRDERECFLRYRSGKDATPLYPELARTIARLPFSSFVLDGELAVLDELARPDFQALQKRSRQSRPRDIARASVETPAVYYAFDLLELEGHDLRDLPLLERKRILREVIPSAGPVRFADHIPTAGEALFDKIVDLGLEGIVAKRADSAYVPGRTEEWQKVRIERTDDFVIVGFSAPSGGRSGFGALHLAAYTDGVLQYMGRVGTGFNEATLSELGETLEPLTVEDCPAAGNVPKGSKHTWVEPKYVCEVRYKEVTDDGHLRHPVFLRLRRDKNATECGAGDLSHAPPTPNVIVEQDPRRVKITNPDKVYWPTEGYTKLDLIQYYRAIAPWALRYLRDRPLVLTRYPDGIEGKSFFQKNAPPYIPNWLRTEAMWSEDSQREVDYFICETPESLEYIANMGAIVLHVWGSRVATLQHPDWCIVDLDPKGAPFEHVVEIAQALHVLCDEIGLPNYCKTSGSTGLHVLVPLGGACTFEHCRALGGVLAQTIAAQLPEIATVERVMNRREGKVYLDYLQNGHGRLLVAPFSVRPLPSAPVSMPLPWDEVRPGLQLSDFTIRSVVERLQDEATDPMVPILSESVDLPAVLARLAARL